MSLSVQKISLDLTIVRFEDGMTPEDFAKELSGVVGKAVWKYTQKVYLNGMKSEYLFYCGMGTNETSYSVLEDGAILIDNTTKKQLGGYSGVSGLLGEIKSQIGDEFKGYDITLSLTEKKSEEDTIDSEQSKVNEANSGEGVEVEENSEGRD